MAPSPQPELDPYPFEFDHADINGIGPRLSVTEFKLNTETNVPRVIVRQITTRPANRNPTTPPFATEMIRCVKSPSLRGRALHGTPPEPSDAVEITERSPSTPVETAAAVCSASAFALCSVAFVLAAGGSMPIVSG